MARYLAVICLSTLFVLGCGETTVVTGSLDALPSATVPASPTATPVPTASPKPLPVKLVDGAGTVRQNGTASLTIRTIKTAKCSIDVRYDTVISTARGLGDKSTDARGMITWKWRVGSNTASGKWSIVVTCKLTPRTGTLTTTMTVK
jgi:hypothetical protein